MDIELIIGILVFIVSLGPLVLYLNIGKILPSLKKWYSKNKIWLNEKELFMLKDKINNIYILIAIKLNMMNIIIHTGHPAVS